MGDSDFKKASKKPDWTPDKDISMEIKKLDPNPKWTPDQDINMSVFKKIRTDKSRE